MTSRPLTSDEKYGRYEAAAKIVLVDFDGSLCHFSYPNLGEPIQGARYFMKALIARGLQPVVWSSRMSPELYTEEERAASIDKIAGWLNFHDIPYHAIDTGNSGKRLCLAYVDDRGVHADGRWDAMLRKIDHIRTNVEAAHRRRRKRNGTAAASDGS